MSLSLLNEGHRTHILAKTVTSEDRQKMAFKNYDNIQYGDIKINDYLPDEMKRQKGQ